MDTRIRPHSQVFCHFLRRLQCHAKGVTRKGRVGKVHSGNDGFSQSMRRAVQYHYRDPAAIASNLKPIGTARRMSRLVTPDNCQIDGIFAG